MTAWLHQKTLFKARHSAQLADKELTTFQDMASHAINLRKLKEQLATCSAVMKKVVFKHGLLAKDHPSITSTEAILDVAFCTGLPPPPWVACKQSYHFTNDGSS